MRAASRQRALAPEVPLPNGSLSNVATVSKLFRLAKWIHFGLGVLKTVPQGLKALISPRRERHG